MLTWTLALMAAGSESQQPLLALLANPVSHVARVDTERVRATTSTFLRISARGVFIFRSPARDAIDPK